MNVERLKKHFLIVLMCIGTVGCSDFSICENTPEKVVASPNGELKAVIFDRGCGATTGFTTGVSILNSVEDLSNADKGNVLLADGAYQETSRSANRVNFEAEWRSDTELLVRHSIATHKQSESVGNVRIRFERKYPE
jgi:hypothetical protein